MADQSAADDRVRECLQRTDDEKPWTPLKFFEVASRTGLDEPTVRAALARLKRKGIAIDIFDAGWRLR